MEYSNDDLIPMNADQAKRVPFPPSSLVYIYNNESPPYVVGTGQVKAVYLKLEFGCSGGTQVLFKVELSPGRMTCCGNSIGADIYGESRKSMFIQASQLRFRNGCPVTVNVPEESMGNGIDQNSVSGVILGICDVPIMHNSTGKRSNCDPGYRYSIQVLEHESGLNSGVPKILQIVKPELVRYREHPTEEQQISSNTAEKIVASSPNTHHVKEEPQNISVEERLQNIPIDEEPAQEAPIIKDEPRDVQPDIFPSHDGTALIQEEPINGAMNTVPPTNSPTTRKRRRLDVHDESTLGDQEDYQHKESSNGEGNHSISNDENGSMLSKENHERKISRTETYRMGLDQKHRRVSNVSVDAFEWKTPNQTSDRSVCPKTDSILSNKSLESGSKNEGEEYQVDLSQTSRAMQVHDDHRSSSTISQFQKEIHGDKVTPGVKSSANEVHWRHIPPGKSESHCKRVEGREFYWHQEYNSGRGMWSMHAHANPQSPPKRSTNTTPSRRQSASSSSSHKQLYKIYIPGFRRDDVFKAIIGERGIKHKQILRSTGLKSLKLLGSAGAPFISIDAHSRDEAQSAVEMILQTLRRELNSSLRDAIVRDD